MNPASYQDRRRRFRVPLPAWAGMVAGIAAAYVFQEVAGLGAPVSLVAALGVLALVTAAAFAIRGTWPQHVPPELDREYSKLRHDGWRLARVHPWWRCTRDTERQPHLHMTAPGGQRRVLISHGVQ